MNFFGHLIAFLLMFVMTANKPNPSVQLLPESWLTIEGRSNVNKFHFEYTFEDYSHNLELAVSVEEDRMVIHPYVLYLPIKEFDCNNAILRQDFRETLKYRKQPEIVIHVDSLPFREVDCGDHGKIQTEVKIGGVTRKETINYQILDNHDGILNMTGKIDLDMACYQLNFDQKFMGLIQIDQIVNITLQLNFKVQE